MPRVSAEILREIKQIRAATERQAILAKEEYVARELGATRYNDPLRLERFGAKVYSQYDEDGIIQEIFRRIGTTNKLFVEFGVESGVENNSLKLLLEGWRGLWIEGSNNYAESIKSRFSDLIDSQRLSLNCSFVTAENINELIGSFAAGDIDLLSIDIDGNDYHIFEALTVVQPRVVVIEYNAKFPPPISITQVYKKDFVWSGTDYMGSSLEALARLARRRGYSLVGCNFPGINAFFVRDDLVDGKFQAPYTAENHYNVARYFLWQLYVSGHPPDWGPYLEVPDDAMAKKSDA
jgi:hypothetical protein